MVALLICVSLLGGPLISGNTGSFGQTWSSQRNDGLGSPSSLSTGGSPSGGQDSDARTAAVSDHSISRGFVANAGQIDDPRILYAYHGASTTYGFAPGGLLVNLMDDEGATVTLTVEFMDAKPVSPAGQERITGTFNYLLGSKSDDGLTGVETFQKVVYRELFQGIDLVFHITPAGLKYDYIVAPGADPRQIRQVYGAVAGPAPELALGADGALRIITGSAELRETAPYSYQLLEGEESKVRSWFSIRGHTVSYHLEPYDATRKLVIDPLIYSTYLGGDDGNESFGSRIAGGPDNSVYVCGSTSALDFPTTLASFTESHKGDLDIFLTRLDANGTEVLYSTFIGGSGRDSCSGLALDDAGNIYLAGSTVSADFPTTEGAFSNISDGYTEEGFVMKLNPQGDRLIFSTFYGGEGRDTIVALDLDARDSVIAVGYTNSGNLPTTANGFAPEADLELSYWDCFLFKLSPDGSRLEYASYFGGNSSDYCKQMTLGPDGSVYLVGETISSDLPTTPDAYSDSIGGNFDTFIARFDTDLSGSASLTYASYFGGQQADHATDVAVDQEGKVYLLGQTWSEDLPIPPEAYQNSSQYQDLFVVKLDPGSSTIEAGSYLGGSNSDWGVSITLDELSNVNILGNTYSPDINTTANAFQERYNDNGDLFLTVLNANLTLASYASYFGGGGYDYGTDLMIDPANGTTVHITGYTNSLEFPVTMTSHDVYSSGKGYGRDAVVFKVNPSADLPKAVIDDITPSTAIEGDNVTFRGHAKEGSLWGWCVWYSSLDGQLHYDNGLTSQFTSNNLSVGEHRIWFGVLDQSGVWSDHANRVITIRAGPRPDAHIRSIAPSPAKVGENILFQGLGLDNGNLTRYEWRSNLDGELYNGTSDNFTLDDLSLGNHRIYFMVQDEDGLWSQEVDRQLAVVENQAPNLKVVSPKNGATIFGTVKISGTAHDLDGEVRKVEYRIDGQGWHEVVGTHLWYLQLDTTTLTDGKHSLSFRSYDGLDHSTIKSRQITIDNLNGSYFRPDLKITVDGVSVPSPVAGSTTDIEIIVDNVGRLEGIVNLSVYLGASVHGNIIGSSLLTIANGSFVTAHIPWTPGQAGETTLFIVLFDHSVVKETNLDNNQAEVTVEVTRAAQPVQDDGPLVVVGAPQMMVISTGLFGGLFLLALAGHEGLRYRAFLTLFPLYSHLKKNEIEKDLKEQSVRGRIYQHIIENPGTHFSLIRKAVKAGNGTTCYHLDVLEREGFVKSIKKGRCRYYFETGIHFPYKLQTRISATALMAMNALHEAGCVSVTELADLLDRSIPTASDTIKTLQRRGFVECQREHKIKLCSLTDRGESFLLKHINEASSN